MMNDAACSLFCEQRCTVIRHASSTYMSDAAVFHSLLWPLLDPAVAARMYIAEALLWCDMTCMLQLSMAYVMCAMTAAMLDFHAAVPTQLL